MAGAFDLATVRAVRLDERLLASLVNVLVSGGRLFCFHEEGGAPLVAAGLRWEAPIALVPTLKSCLTIGIKR